MMLLAAFRAGADIVYDFSKETPQNRSFVRNWASNIADRRIEDGLLKGKALKALAYFVPIKVDRRLSEVQLLAVEIKVGSDAGKIQIFANLDEPSAGYLEQPLVCDGEFHTYLFDLGEMAKVKQAGILKSFRLNPVTAPADFAIRSIKLAPGKSGEDIVYDFKNETPKNRHFLRGWANSIAERRIEDGALAGKTLKHPAYFSPVKVDRPLADVQLLTVEMKVAPGEGKIQIFANLGEPSQAFLQQPLICDGEFHTYCFDLEGMSKVKQAGVLKNFRLGPVTAPAEFAIRSVRLAPRRRHLPGGRSRRRRVLFGDLLFQRRDVDRVLKIPVGINMGLVGGKTVGETAILHGDTAFFAQNPQLLRRQSRRGDPAPERLLGLRELRNS